MQVSTIAVVHRESLYLGWVGILGGMGKLIVHVGSFYIPPPTPHAGWGAPTIYRLVSMQGRLCRHSHYLG